MMRTGAIAIAVWLCGALAATAQPQPTPEQIDRAFDVLRHGLGEPGSPPAAYDLDPIEDWMLPRHQPLVLADPELLTPPDTPAAAADDAPAEDPEPDAAPPEEAAPAQDAAPPAPAKKPVRERQIAREPEPEVRTGRAAAEKAPERKKPVRKPAPKAPVIVLPERLRP